MKNQLLIGGIVLILVVVGFTGCVGPESTDFFNEEYEIDAGTVLRVLNTNGPVEIIPWDGETLVVDAVKRTNFGREELDEVEIVVEKKDSVLLVETSYPLYGARVSVNMNIKIPENLTVEQVSTSNGAIQISGTHGNLSVQTSNGAIIIDDVDGYVEARTSNGAIDIQDSLGIDSIETSNGRITAEIFHVHDDVTIQTSNGRITLYLNESLNINLKALTSNGEITMSGLLLNYTRFEKTHIEGSLGLGGHQIYIQTSNGDIDLYKLAR